MKSGDRKGITFYDLQSAKEERIKLEKQGYKKVKITREGGKYIVQPVGEPEDGGPMGTPGQVLDDN
jgi:hypothetical protein